MYTEQQLQTNARKSTEVKKRREKRSVHLCTYECDGERRQKSSRTENDYTHNRDLPSI